MIVVPLLAAAMALPTEMPVEVHLDATGKVVGCAMQDPAMDAASSQRVCMAMLRNAHFEPGRDSAGNPVPSKTMTTVRRRARAATPAELASAEARVSTPPSSSR